MSKERGSGIGKFVLGAAIGAGLGILFAPKKGSETRAELKVKIDELVEQAKQIDVEEVKAEFLNKVDDIKDELADLDSEKALDLAKRKAADLKIKSQELVDLAIDKGTPILRDAAEEVRLKAVDVTKDVLKKLEGKDTKKTKKEN
ncbi:MAG: YtxH domain-containing protein [Bacilli bacterium]|nr:YtxH domain-containing protein [Bacilli bacterium]